MAVIDQVNKTTAVSQLTNGVGPLIVANRNNFFCRGGYLIFLLDE